MSDDLVEEVARLDELLEAWLHTTEDQDVAYFGTVVLSAIRSLTTEEKP